MSLINRGAHICIITTPEFFAWQQKLEQTSCWASGQFTGRISRHEMLPKELSRADLEAVVRRVLPEAGDVDVSALAAYASSSARYLAAIDSIVEDARYIAASDGRDTVRRADIQRAMREGVIPSDRSLAAAIQSTAPKRGKRALTDVQTPVVPPLNEPSEGEVTATPAAAPSEAPVRGGVEISSARHGRAVRPAGDLAGV
jgi:histone H3/H4